MGPGASQRDHREGDQVKRWASAVLVVVLVVAAVFAWRWMFPSDEARIRKVIADAARAASVVGNEGALGMTLKAAELASFCTENASVRVNALGVHGGLDGRDQIRQAAMQFGTTFGNFRVRPAGVQFVEQADSTARVTMTVTFEGAAPADINAQEFEVTFSKVGKRWLIAKVTTISTLRR